VKLVCKLCAKWGCTIGRLGYIKHPNLAQEIEFIEFMDTSNLARGQYLVDPIYVT